MAFFNELNEKIIKVLQLVQDNQDLCKYLYYPQKDPLQQSNISDTSILMMKNLFPLPKTPDSIIEKTSILNVYFPSSKPYRNNSGFRELFLNFDIMCHIDIWMTEYGIRPYNICSYIDTMFNNQYISDLSVNKIYFDNDGMIRFSDYFYGYRLTYKLSSESNVGS